MKKVNVLKRAISLILSFCLVLSGAFTNTGNYVYAAEGDGTASTTVYFYNDANWTAVKAYAYDPTGKIADTNLLGGWSGTEATSVSELGENWWKVDVPVDASTSPFCVIFNDGAEQKGKDVYISNSTNVYTNSSSETAYATAAEAGGVTEEPQPPVDPANNTTVYFYNDANWTAVKAYAYDPTGKIADTNLLGGWSGTEATSVSELGENWWKVDVPADASTSPFCVIFNDGAEQKGKDVYISNNTNVYTNSSSETAYATAAEAGGVTEDPQPPVDPANNTTVYFYNDANWTAVKAYAYDPTGKIADTKLLGGWSGTEATSESELGENWWKVDVPADASTSPFCVIFNNGADQKGKDVYISNNTNVYTNSSSETAYATAAEAGVVTENPQPPVDPANNTTVYFYNSSDWETVGAYVYNSVPAEALGGWGKTNATAAPELGDKWVKVDVPASAPFSIIFFNTEEQSQRAELGIPDAEHVYVAINAVAYTSAEELLDEVANAKAEIYFINSENWSKVYAYAEDAEGNYIGSKKPGIKATKTTALGDKNWYKVTIPTSAIINPFKVTFSNGGNKTTEAYEVKVNTNNYASVVGLFDSKSKALNSVGLGDKTTAYFLNTEDWPTIGAYVWGDPGEVLGGWGNFVLTEEMVDSTIPVDENNEAAGVKTWYKFEIESEPPFHIIMFNKENQDVERIDVEIADKEVYITPNGLWGSKEEAELSEGLGDLSRMTTVYFLNHRGWGDINTYAFSEKEDGSTVTIGKGWPGLAATKAEGVGTSDKWWSFAVPKDASVEGNGFGIIFNDGVNQTDDIMIENKEYVYAIAYGASHKLFKTPEEAEAAVAKDPYEDNCEEGPNTDILNYNVSYTGEGANLPFVTYEAEAANTNATVLEKQTAYRESIQSEASGRQAVELKSVGDYVEFTLTEAANSVVLRYAIPDSEDGEGIDATLSMYVDGTEKQNLDVTSKYAWLYGVYPFNNKPDNKAHRYYDEVRVLFDETMPAGTKIKLQKDTDDEADYYVIDFIDCELVGTPGEQPENSLSVVDFGATPDDDTDDAEAFRQCIQAASEVGMEVWIPAGTFILEEEEALDVTAVTIRGAGMWHTNLVGAGVSFHYRGTCKFYDFAMTGVSRVRDDSGDLACFEGMSRSTNVTIQNIWMEHVKVGVWANNIENLAVYGCRIRNTWADGINMCSGTYNAVIENNNLRNTGDDCIAIWPWLADCGNNTIRHNTVMVPSLANGIAIYGGYGHVVEQNHVYDIIGNGGGICVGTEFDTAKPYSGTITVRNNLLERCGSMQFDENYPIGSVWIWAAGKAPLTGTDAIIVENNTVKDSVHSAFLIECENEVDDVIIRNNTVEGGTDVIHVLKNSIGSGEQYGNTADGYSGKFVNNKNENFEFLETININGTYGQKVSEMTRTGSLAEEGTWTVVEGADEVPEVGSEKAYKVSDGKTTVEVVPVVAKKPITVVADNSTKVFDGNAYTGELTFTHDPADLVGDDTVEDLAVTLMTTDATEVGEYPIVGTSTSANYDVTVTPGTLLITQKKAEIVIGTASYTKKFGDADFALDVTVNGDGVPTYSVSAAEGEKKEADKIITVSEDGTVSVKGSGKAVITVNVDATANYVAADPKQITVTVEKAEYQDGIYANGIGSVVYTGSAIKPVPVVFDGLTETELVAGKDYTVSYKNNTKVYTLTEGAEGFNKNKAPQVIIKGKGNYSATLVEYFTITQKDINSKDVEVNYTSEFIFKNANLKPLSDITYNGKKVATSEYGVEYFLKNADETYATTPTKVKAVGTYKMVITTKDKNFTGSVEKEVTVFAKDTKTYLKDMVIAIEGSTRAYSTPYTGKAIKPEVTVTPKGRNQVPVSEDAYSVNWDNNVEIGTATITITGKTEMGIIGTVTKTFKITGTKLSSVAKVDTTEWKSSVPYDIKTGVAIQPTDVKGKNLVKLTAKSSKYAGTALVEGIHYEVSYKKNDKPGTATMVFTGIGKYTGTVTKTFKVTKIDLAKAGEELKVTGVATEADYVKAGSKIALNVTYNGQKLVEGTDYKVTYSNNKAVTTATTAENKMPKATITGLGVFSGKAVDHAVPFTINKMNMANLNVTAADVVWQDKKGKFMVVPVVTDANGAKLANNRDFTCSYNLVTEAGKTELTKDDAPAVDSVIEVVVTAKDGSNYTLSNSATYEVKEKSIAKATIKIKSQDYTGNPVKITAEDITTFKVGNEKFTAEDINNKYEIVEESYKDNVDKGTASVTIRGLGNYGGEKTVTFKITTRTMAWWWNLLP